MDVSREVGKISKYYVPSLRKDKMIKFVFSKKATNIEEIFTIDLTICR